MIGNGRVYSAGADTNIAVWGEDSLEIKKTIEVIMSFIYLFIYLFFL